jgi:mRNA-degrading endonuclease RelE of RelBE toxin-antitoxin system
LEPYRVRVPASVADLIVNLHPNLKRKVRAGLDAIRTDPTCGKALREPLVGLRSLRVGRFRVIYRLGRAGVIDLVAIGPRRTIYEETIRLLRSPDR